MAAGTNAKNKMWLISTIMDRLLITANKKETKIKKLKKKLREMHSKIKIKMCKSQKNNIDKLQ